MSLALSGELWCPIGRYVRREHLTASCAHLVRLQAVTIVSRFARIMPPIAALSIVLSGGDDAAYTATRISDAFNYLPIKRI